MKLVKILALASLVAPAIGEKFNNPVLWQDLADVEIIRVNDTFYYTASTMHFSPGAPILRSYDLINWEFIGHSVPSLDFGPRYDLADGQQGYRGGVWASSLQYRKSNKLFYWLGCIDFWTTYIYTSPSPTGPWTRHTQIYSCYYDAGLLIDDDDTMYVAHSSNTIKVAQLSSDGRTEVKVQEVWTKTSDINSVEGSRFYKINGKYYIFIDQPSNAQYILKSDSPWGPYTAKQVLKDLVLPIDGTGTPHQGGLIQTQTGAWYYMAFVDNYPGGRTPVLAPITWDKDGWPSVSTVNGQWAVSYDYPLPKRVLASPEGTDTFPGTSLSPQWEWNHNPDTTKFTVNNGLTLRTATRTWDLYTARNTLTHRILGPTSTATILLNYKNMKSGDRSGLAMFRDDSAWVGVKNEGGVFSVAMTSGLSMDANWNTLSNGTEVTSTVLPTNSSRIWLRAAADIHGGFGRQATFSYSTDGSRFLSIGSPLTLNATWYLFMGYRYGIFNYATTELGGSVLVNSFTMTKGI